jgi:hypothetical protein
LHAGSAPTLTTERVSPTPLATSTGSRRRRDLRLDPAPGSGPRRASWTRRGIHARELKADLPGPQRPRGAAGLRRRVDGPLHRKSMGGRPHGFTNRNR